MKRQADLVRYPENRWDLVVVGGGAAGFFGALSAAESCPTSARIIIVEKASQVLGKVRISGGGRCNVTHACFDPRTFAAHYPRGEKALIGPLNRWGAQHTIQWFADRGVELKTESDGRMFPVSDNSETIIECLTTAASDKDIQVKTGSAITEVTINQSAEYPFLISIDGKQVSSRKLLLAAGGTRSSQLSKLVKNLGHSLTEPVPSLFTFNIPGDSLRDLAGVSVADIVLSVPELELQSSGPLLITHRGLSGPAVLKLSAWGARVLHSVDYIFDLRINWLPQDDPDRMFNELRLKSGKRAVCSRSPFAAIPRRLWERMVQLSGIPDTLTWSQLPKALAEKLTATLKEGIFKVRGKNLNKEEFVTCGGVELKEINLRTMESRRVPGLYFAGEIMDVDGLTGGFNFQNAWTTGFLAGSSMASG